MIVDDLHLMGVAVPPHKTNTERIVDPDRVLATPVALEHFESVSWAEVRQGRRRVQPSQRAARCASDAIESRDSFAFDKTFGPFVTATSDHSLV
jgi:hypothetical protein